MILNNTNLRMCHRTKREVSFVQNAKSTTWLNWKFSGFIFIYELNVEPHEGVALKLCINLTPSSKENYIWIANYRFNYLQFSFFTKLMIWFQNAWKYQHLNQEAQIKTDHTVQSIQIYLKSIYSIQFQELWSARLSH